MIHEPTVVLKPEMVRIGETSRIDAFCKIEGGLGVQIGERVHVASYCHLNLGGGSLVIEDSVGLSSGVAIATGTNVPRYGRSSSACDPENVAERGFVRICKNAILFAHCVILQGVTVGEGAVIAAGAVVMQDVAPWTVVAGVPAKFKKMVDGHPSLNHTPFCAARYGDTPCTCWGQK